MSDLSAAHTLKMFMSDTLTDAFSYDLAFQWKEILEKTLADLDKEIADLSEAKELTENALEAKNIPTDTAIECLTIREGRHSIDVVQDEVENQLHKVRSHCVCVRVCVSVCECV